MKNPQKKAVKYSLYIISDINNDFDPEDTIYDMKNCTDSLVVFKKEDEVEIGTREELCEDFDNHPMNTGDYDEFDAAFKAMKLK